MGVIELLTQRVEIRQQMLQREIHLKAECPEASSDEAVDEKKLDLIDAQIELAKATVLAIPRLDPNKER
jgi:hypothetical protein